MRFLQNIDQDITNISLYIYILFKIVILDLRQSWIKWKNKSCGKIS